MEPPAVPFLLLLSTGLRGPGEQRRPVCRTRGWGGKPQGPPVALREAARPVLCRDRLAKGRTARPHTPGTDPGSQPRPLFQAEPAHRKVGTVPLPTAAGGGTAGGCYGETPRALPGTAHAAPPGLASAGGDTRGSPTLRRAVEGGRSLGPGPAAREDAGQWSPSPRLHVTCEKHSKPRKFGILALFILK